MLDVPHTRMTKTNHNDDGGGDSKDGANGVGADEVDQEGHESSIFTIAFSPNGKLLVTGGQDGFCRSVAVGEARVLKSCRLWRADGGWSCSQKWEHARC